MITDEVLFRRVFVNAVIHPVHLARPIQVLVAVHTNLSAFVNDANIPALTAVAAHLHLRTALAPALQILHRLQQGLAVAPHPPHFLILSLHEDKVTNVESKIKSYSSSSCVSFIILKLRKNLIRPFFGNNWK
ncbi:hypothetical protein ACTXT7_007052 [Hymenolepis weldensis]